MAVIQDLPPELLRRILELLCEEYRSSVDLRNTSLVAPAWRSPSQDLMVYNADTTLTREADVRLGVGLKSLEIFGPCSGLHSLPPDTTLELKNLRLNAEFPPSPDLLSSLFEAAPALTRHDITLTTCAPSLPADYESPMRFIAARLHHLKIVGLTARGGPWIGNESFDVAGFLTACTSLKTLELQWMRTHIILELLEHLNARLDVLATQVLFEDDFRAVELIAALELPALGSLKRWRVWKNNVNSSTLTPAEGDQWAEACRARGIEPRDDRRFFTDYAAE